MTEPVSVVISHLPVLDARVGGSGEGLEVATAPVSQPSATETQRFNDMLGGSRVDEVSNQLSSERFSGDHMSKTVSNLFDEISTLEGHMNLSSTHLHERLHRISTVGYRSGELSGARLLDAVFHPGDAAAPSSGVSQGPDRLNDLSKEVAKDFDDGMKEVETMARLHLDVEFAGGSGKQAVSSINSLVEK